MTTLMPTDVQKRRTNALRYGRLLLGMLPVLAVTAAPAGPSSLPVDQSVTVPDVPLIRMDGTSTTASAVLDRPGPILLDFVFTTCGTICPTLSATFAQVQKLATQQNPAVELVSVSIDPVHDTPRVLGDYAKNFKAGPHWQFYTGTREAIVSLQRAFHSYGGDKMNHANTIFLRKAGQQTWQAIEGPVSATRLLEQIR
jgi:protein SCO1/2